MIRIDFGITDLDVGGAERMLVELATRLDPSAFSVRVVCLQPEGRLAEPLENAGIAVHSLGLASPMGAFRALRRWKELLRERSPDILQTFLFHANLLGRIAGRRAGVKRVVNGIRVAERRGRWRHWADRWTHQLATRHVCVSEGVRQLTAARSRIPLERLIVIPNGIDLSAADSARAVDRAQFDAGPQDTVLLFVGRLDPQKGLNDLLHALELIRNDSPKGAARLRFAIVGDGPQRAALEQTVASLRLDGIIRFMGWRPNSLDWILGADGLVLPSLWEGMPNVVLEAMALRRPVIATSVEGTNELVLADVTGWLVPPGDVPALARAIGEFVENPERRAELGAAGRARVEQSFTIERMVAAYEGLYRSLMDEADGAS